MEAHEIHHGKGLDCMPVVSRGFENHTGVDAISPVSTPILWENILGEGSGSSHLSSFSTSLTRGLVTRRLFRVPPCYEGTIHL
ncbi:hypothetical protein TNCV_2005561 [Trichonephila clavipes]|nr:hypothetical protein TNCV_2005561 [Trichonephila clavipes]